MSPSRVFVDLDNPKAMQQAADLLAEPSLGLRVTAYGRESGITKNFKNYQEINDYLNTVVHEVYHQVQYNENRNAFKQLIIEFLVNEKKSRLDNIDNYTYNYDKNNIEKKLIRYQTYLILNHRHNLLKK